jgi:hypothetical protein
VYSAIGQEMKFATWQQGSKVKIDSRSFTPGTYFLVVQNNQMQYCTTFVKCNGY